MDEEQPRKKGKKRKKVRWEEIPPKSSRISGIMKKYDKSNEASRARADDSEPDLVIDTDVEENFPTAIGNLEEEIEKQLEEKAVKNHLSVMNVKNILKAVITNKDVVDMVNTSLKGEHFNNFRPKLTRSKTKELMESYEIEQGSKNKSDYAYILEEELLEDSSDDEYNPQESSDDENKTAELLPESPVPDSPYVSICEDDDDLGVDIENIGQRTRSKLSLSETPLEAIEQQFIPPDITTDMYDTECDNQDWFDFLKGIQNPMDDRATEVGEDENDPEYNVMVEEAVEKADFEELRHDRAVKVTKTELHTLMNEWFGCEDFSSEDEEESSQKKQPKNSLSRNQDKTRATSSTHPPLQPVCHPSQGELFSNLSKMYNRDNFFSPEQYILLRQQIQQHIQLLLQTFLITHKHPFIEHEVPSKSKEMLYSMNCLAAKQKSTLNVSNLPSSISLLQRWESYMSNATSSAHVVQFMEREFLNGDTRRKKKPPLPAKLPPQLMDFCADSTAFVYPLLLPSIGVTFNCTRGIKADYSQHENHLIAIGLEQFYRELQLLNSSIPKLLEICRNISFYLMPHREPRSIMAHVKWLSKDTDPNPIKHYYQHKQPPPIKHFVINTEQCIRLRDHPPQLIPPDWKKHFFKKRKVLLLKYKQNKNK